MTQLDYAKKNKPTKIIECIAASEAIEVKSLLKKIADGRVVIPSNTRRTISKPCGIGEGLSTKVNANIGTSEGAADLDKELKKLKVAVASGADTVMDLSTGGDLKKIRHALLENCPIPFGTVPIYEIAKISGSIKDINESQIFTILEAQAKEGVDFFTIHAGLTLGAIGRLKKDKRVLDIVSRGGAILAQWMLANKKENPFFENFDKILELASSYDITLSLGDALRPGSVADATDRAQIEELITLGELAKKAFEKNVQIIIEGPGHVPINEIEVNVRLEKSLCNNAPFYVLGPLVTDIAPGYDHITSAIGGAIAASYGADFLCYVTPSEHLALPDIEDVRLGVISSKIAAHAADIAKGIPGALQKDIAMSIARKKRDWEKQFKLSIDGLRARKYRDKPGLKAGDVCSMCDEFCSIKLSEECL